MKRYHVYVTSKKGIFDPPGEAAKHALDNLGYKDVADVKIGKFIEIEGDMDEATVEQMCSQLLANPIIEDFRIEAVAGGE